MCTIPSQTSLVWMRFDIRTNLNYPSRCRLLGPGCDPCPILPGLFELGWGASWKLTVGTSRQHVRLGCGLVLRYRELAPLFGFAEPTHSLRRPPTQPTFTSPCHTFPVEVVLQRPQLAVLAWESKTQDYQGRATILAAYTTPRPVQLFCLSAWQPGAVTVLSGIIQAASQASLCTTSVPARCIHTHYDRPCCDTLHLEQGLLIDETSSRRGDTSSEPELTVSFQFTQSPRPC
jgi:hypothetical protein